MPHFIDFDGLHESVFLLEHLCLSSRSYCDKHNVHRDIEKSGACSWEYYAGMLKTYVSERLIQNSARVRIIQDLLKKHSHAEDEPLNLNSLNREAIEGSRVAWFLHDSSELSLREACNKVLHATDTRLCWSESEDLSYFFWSGRVILYGEQGGTEWAVELDVESYAHVIYRWLSLLDSEVDWQHIYEDDE